MSKTEMVRQLAETIDQIGIAKTSLLPAEAP